MPIRMTDFFSKSDYHFKCYPLSPSQTKFNIVFIYLFLATSLQSSDISVPIISDVLEARGRQ